MIRKEGGHNRSPSLPHGYAAAPALRAVQAEMSHASWLQHGSEPAPGVVSYPAAQLALVFLYLDFAVTDMWPSLCFYLVMC